MRVEWQGGVGCSRVAPVLLWDAHIQTPVGMRPRLWPRYRSGDGLSKHLPQCPAFPEDPEPWVIVRPRGSDLGVFMVPCGSHHVQNIWGRAGCSVRLRWPQSLLGEVHPGQHCGSCLESFGLCPTSMGSVWAVAMRCAHRQVWARIAVPRVSQFWSVS